MSWQAEALTGIADPVFSAKALLEKGENTKWVIVKMGEKGCLMITTRGIYQVPAFKVIFHTYCHDYSKEGGGNDRGGEWKHHCSNLDESILVR
jgi:hypothetical protein